MKYQIETACLEDTETIVQFQLNMARESEDSELDYTTVREGGESRHRRRFQSHIPIGQGRTDGRSPGQYDAHDRMVRLVQRTLLLDSIGICAPYSASEGCIQGIVRICQNHRSERKCSSPTPVCRQEQHHSAACLSIAGHARQPLSDVRTVVFAPLFNTIPTTQELIN